jgi:hypothetical protein
MLPVSFITSRSFCDRAASGPCTHPADDVDGDFDVVDACSQGSFICEGVMRHWSTCFMYLQGYIPGLQIHTLWVKSEGKYLLMLEMGCGLQQVWIGHCFGRRRLAALHALSMPMNDIDGEEQ